MVKLSIKRYFYDWDCVHFYRTLGRRGDFAVRRSAASSISSLSAAADCAALRLAPPRGLALLFGDGMALRPCRGVTSAGAARAEALSSPVSSNGAVRLRAAPAPAADPGRLL